MIRHILQTSLTKSVPVTIIYIKDSEITKRSIKVLDISDDSVRAYCCLRNGIRVFKKENILAASITGVPAPAAPNRARAV